MLKWLQVDFQIENLLRWGCWSVLLHRMGEVGMDNSGSSGSTSLPKQGHLKAHGTGLCPVDSGISPIGETPQSGKSPRINYSANLL